MKHDLLLVDSIDYFFKKLKDRWDHIPELVVKASRHDLRYESLAGDVLTVAAVDELEHLRGKKFHTLLLQTERPIPASVFSEILRRCEQVERLYDIT